MLWTEKEIESFLESESRELVGPDGEAFWHTNFALYWDIYDSLILLNELTGEEIVGWTQNWVRQHKIDFAEAFRGILGDLDNRRRNAWGLI